MKQFFKLMIVPFLGLFLFAGGALADNITIWDGIGEDPGTGLTAQRESEKNETEPLMLVDGWSLESFMLTGNNLSVTSYFPLNAAKEYDGNEYFAGDIFIATGDAPQYGIEDGTSIELNYGYDFVIDIDWVDKKYSVYSLSDDASFVKITESLNDPESNPYNFNAGINDTALTGFLDRSFEVTTSEVTISNELYTASSFDLSFIGADQEFWAHLTLSCGNDSMMGHGTTAPVPEPATLLLLGTGLVGLAGVSRKKLKK